MTAKKGMRVHVFSGNHQEDWGFGTITKVEPIDWTDNDGNIIVHTSAYPSEITLDDGRKTEGCQCWWCPIQDSGKKEGE